MVWMALERRRERRAAVNVGLNGRECLRKGIFAALNYRFEGAAYWNSSIHQSAKRTKKYRAYAFAANGQTHARPRAAYAGHRFEPGNEHKPISQMRRRSIA